MSFLWSSVSFLSIAPNSHPVCPLRPIFMRVCFFITLGTNTTPSGSTTTGGASTATGGTSGTQTGTPTGTASVPATGSATGSVPAATPTQSRSPMDPRASLTMLQPKVNIKDPPLFPLGVDIQFSWDYDQYLKLQPANLTIEAYLPDNSIITIADAIAGNLKNYTWPAAKQLNQTNPISTAIYTLRIFDGNVGRFGVLPEGGYLSTFVGLKFGLYRPSAYIPGSQMNRKYPLALLLNCRFVIYASILWII